MVKHAKIATTLAATLWLSACGPEVTEVWLQFEEDGSLPCLGSSHMRLQVNLPGQKPDRMLFDNFGIYFDDTTFRCHVDQELRFPNMPTGRGLGVQVQFTDSSTDAAGVLAEANSNAFDVSGGSPVQQVTVSLYRKPGVQQGTIRVFKPGDWGVVGGVSILQFRVIKDADGSTVRAYYISYDPVSRPDPFPLAISNLPVPQFAELFMLYIEGLDSGEQLLRTWSKPVYLGGENTLFSIQL